MKMTPVMKNIIASCSTSFLLISRGLIIILPWHFYYNTFYILQQWFWKWWALLRWTLEKPVVWSLWIHTFVSDRKQSVGCSSHASARCAVLVLLFVGSWVDGNFLATVRNDPLAKSFDFLSLVGSTLTYDDKRFHTFLLCSELRWWELCQNDFPKGRRYCHILHNNARLLFEYIPICTACLCFYKAYCCKLLPSWRTPLLNFSNVSAMVSANFSESIPITSDIRPPLPRI